MNVLLFGPNGSGKGTQGAVVKEKYNIPHIESGVIFREHITGATDLGKKAKGYMDRGELVPDKSTIPMIIDRLGLDDCKGGWLLDGFPRNLTQARELNHALEVQGIHADIVVEIVLDRETAKNRIMGRRLCVNDNNHPNNVFIDAILPDKDRCRVCGGGLNSRSDDQDEEAIDKRHSIYYDMNTGTMASVHYFKELSAKTDGTPKIIEVDGSPGVKQVSSELLRKLAQ